MKLDLPARAFQRHVQIEQSSGLPVGAGHLWQVVQGCDALPVRQRVRGTLKASRDEPELSYFGFRIDRTAGVGAGCRLHYLGMRFYVYAAEDVESTPCLIELRCRPWMPTDG